MEISSRTLAVSKKDGDGYTERRNTERQIKLCKIIEIIVINKNLFLMTGCGLI